MSGTRVPPEGTAREAEARDVVPGQARDDEGEELRAEVENGAPMPRLGRETGKLESDHPNLGRDQARRRRRSEVKRGSADTLWRRTG